MTHGFLRVAAATTDCSVGDVDANVDSILALAREAARRGASLAVFPELSVTAYTCGDLFAQDALCQAAARAVSRIAESTADLPTVIVVGFPYAAGAKRYNCAAVISAGAVVGVVPKSHIPNYGEFYELRHFSPAPDESGEPNAIPAGRLGPAPVPFGTRLLFCDRANPDIAFAVEICEDLWVPIPPSAHHAQAGALVIANLSASNEIVGKAAYRRNLVTGQSGHCVGAYVYADAGGGESTTDMVFSGHNLIAENGSMLAESRLFSTGLTLADVDTDRLLQERRRVNTFTAAEAGYRRIAVDLSGGTAHRAGFAPSGASEATIADEAAKTDRAPGTTARPRLLRKIDPLPFVPAAQADLAKRCEEVLSIQTAGLIKRLAHTKSRSVVLGLSGGLDSTLALLVIVRAFDALGLDRSGILAITMPGFGTTAHTRGNALKLAALLGTATEEIPINKAVRQHFADIGHDPAKLDVTYENSQARERTQILMDKANQTNGLVIGTGDLSELALGWATYNGDHMSMYAVNASIPKTLVRHLVRYCADHPESFFPESSVVPAGGEKPTTVTSAARRRDFAKVLISILETPVSPELLPPTDGKISQKTEGIVGPYELHDFFLYYVTRWGFSPAKVFFLATEAFATGNDPRVGAYQREEILTWMKSFYRRFFAQQFKRSCLPDGPKAGSVTLSPRGDWRMPSDASSALWLKELESL